MRRYYLLFVLFLLLPLTVSAQVDKVRGQVVDVNSEPVIGAVVRVNGTNLSVVTNYDGNYELSGLPHHAVLTFSYLGMRNEEVKVTSAVINVTLVDDATQLEELVVIGYGVAKSKDLTSPIETVKAAEIASVPSSSPMGAIQGKVAGVNVVSSGTPGAGPTVTIRGLGSFGNTSPLYVVDGMFYDNINFLNNSDIEEMAILKDASASAIYGVRAANGVVIITTKKGKNSENAKISYEGYVGVQNATNLLEMCNSSQYAQMLRESGITDYDAMLKSSIQHYGGNFESNQYGADTDWYDQLLRTAVITNHSLNIVGGTEKATYGVGASYLYQNGIMKTDNDYKRLNFRGNVDYKATKWLTVGMNAMFVTSEQQLPNNAAWQQAFNMPGIFPVYDPATADTYTDGYTSPNTIGVTSNFYNPVATADFFDSNNKSYQVLSNFYATINLIPEKLNLKTSYSYDYTGMRATSFIPEYYLGTVQNTTKTALTKSDSNFNNYVWDNTLTYDDSWDLHHLTAMAGASMRQESFSNLTGSAQNVPDGQDSWKYLSLGDKEGITLSDDGFRNRGLSYFARLAYNYAHRYLLTVTFRADGSSKYNDKWGYFPSVGGAWVVSEEPFMKNQKVFDFLKLRASWGKLGNDKIAASAGYAAATTNRAVFGTNNALDGYINGSTFSWLAWEVVKETNVGLNFSTLGNRLTADIDWYCRLTDNAVISPTRPMQNTTVAGNWGQILNTGVDVTLNWNQKVSDDFSYQVGANLTWLHNEVKSLKDGITMLQGGKTVQVVGEKMNSYYGYKVVGVYQTEAACQADPIAVANGLQPGDFKYEDVNADGVIDGSDKQVLGSYVPDLTYGFNVGLQWKALDFNMSFYGQAGGEIWNRKRALRYAAQNYNFDKAQFDDRWTGSGSTDSHPSAAALMRSWNIGDSQNASYFVESSDYFRVQNINLGYTLKNLKVGGYTLPSMRLSMTADRPLTVFSAHSFTPELSDAEGWDTEVYPLTATYTFGVQINF
mgnify:CR=1 FL=1|jgi:TonB-linked SusC/RagA family outer membrane protein